MENKSAKSLIEQQVELEAAKADEIERLLAERDQVLCSAAIRSAEIKEELKALGYHRKPKSAKALDASGQNETVDSGNSESSD